MAVTTVMVAPVATEGMMVKTIGEMTTGDGGLNSIDHASSSHGTIA